MKLTIELEIDQAAYDAKYGPGTEWWKRNKVERVLDGGENQFGPTYTSVPMPASEYEFAEGKVEQALTDMIVDILYEGLYDWRNLREDGSALKIAVNGKAACTCCAKTEGHEDWCVVIAGPEASA